MRPAPIDLVRAEGARTESYVARGAAIVVDDSLVAWLKERLEAGGGHTVRACLHPGPEATLHQMLILHRRGGVFRAHKHVDKDEAYQMVEGRLRVRLYDEGGALTQDLLLGAPGSGLPWLLRIQRGTWHSTVPETDLAVFIEARPGPFRGDDSVLAAWAQEASA